MRGVLHAGATAETKTGRDEDVWAFRRVEESPMYWLSCLCCECPCFQAGDDRIRFLVGAG